MATSWQEILDLGSRESANASAAPEPEPERRGVFKRLRESLSKSRQALTEEISASLFERIDDETWERLEEALILADAGAPTTAAVVERLEHEVDAGTVPADGAAVRDRLIEILAEVAADRPRPDRPQRRAGGADDGRRQRHRQDDDDRQDRLAPEQGDGAVGRPRRRRHLPRRRRRAAGRVGASGPAPNWSAARRAPTPARSPSTRSPPPTPAAPTSSSSTPPAASTPRTT